MSIKNDRTKKDHAGLYAEENKWKGMRCGETNSEEYPAKGRFKQFLIAGY